MSESPDGNATASANPGREQNPSSARPSSLLEIVIYFCLREKIVVLLLILALVGGGIYVAPFDWNVGGIERHPVAVDAIPDIGENQQIVFTEWTGRSPQDVEDQITYPLTVALLGIPEVKTIRSYSFFGFSSIYVIFNENAEFYWSRSRVLEKLNSLPAGTLPDNVQPALGPDATALGQIFWYTLEGHDPDGNPIGGFDLHELRSIQDWTVRYALASAEGISEVASVGGFVQEYQIDVDPDAMRAYGVTLTDVFQGVRMSNVDVGARTIELNRVEYIVRGLGLFERLSDIEKVVLKTTDGVPITVKDVGTVTLGPALRRGALDKGGAEAVGGVVVVRYGYNPLQAIKNVKARIAAIQDGLPTRVILDTQQTTRHTIEDYAREHGFNAFITAEPDHAAWTRHLRGLDRADWPAWANLSQVAIVPFYDRTDLINETLGTLNTALYEEILVTILVIIISVWHLRNSILISGLLPLAVLMCFVAMKFFGVDANIVALSGIAIAIGTMVDMGIVLCENILRQLDDADPTENKLDVVFRASSEVGGAVLTAVATTVVSFLPVFAMIGAEGKLFRPLAFTKTFALIASVIVALTIIPPMAHILFAGNLKSIQLKRGGGALLIGGGIAGGLLLQWWIAGSLLVGIGLYLLLGHRVPGPLRWTLPVIANLLAILFVVVLLTTEWLPLGPDKGVARNLIFVIVLIGGLLAFFQVFQRFVYPPLLRWCLNHKLLFLITPTLIVILGGCAWLGFATIFGWVPAAAQQIGFARKTIEETRPWKLASDTFPGLGREFMPALDEGSFLYMPTTMPHASIGEASEILQLQNKMIASIPEVEMVTGKLGRADSPLDPAPVSMIETIIAYKSEFKVDKNGHRIRFKFDESNGEFIRSEAGSLIEDPNGRPFRQWRDEIRSPDDIWKEITQAAEIPGTTSAPKLQPIAARIVMLQSGMRAPMGIKVRGPDLETIEQIALELEQFLKQVESVKPSAVIADRIVGKPYIEIDIDRDAIKRYGLHIRSVQDVIEVAIGGRRLTTTVEGRERYPVRVRYARELRDEIETIGRILVPTPSGTQIPLEQLADIQYVRGPQVLKSEDTFLVGYVLFDMMPGHAEVDVVEECQRFLKQKIATGELVLPPGVSYQFAGNYENQVRSQKTLSLILPISLFVIFIILYFQFRSVATTALVFSGIMVAWAGGFLMLWLYAQPWFLDFSVFGTDMRSLFQVHSINLSVAVWVGFLALFGIASDDGVVMATYLDQSLRKTRVETVKDARDATHAAGLRRVRPCLMTTATTILALIPILTSTGRGSDIMVPMAIPSFGGMLIAVITMFVVPVLFAAVQEWKLKLGIHDNRFERAE